MIQKNNVSICKLLKNNNIYENVDKLIQNMSNSKKYNVSKYSRSMNLTKTNLNPFDVIYYFIDYNYNYNSRKIIDYIYEKIEILSSEEKIKLSVIILKKITQKYFVEFSNYSNKNSYNYNLTAVKNVMTDVKYLILILYKLGKKYFRTIHHIDILINSYIYKFKKIEKIEILDSSTNSYYTAIKNIFDGSKINQGSTINEELSINKELNELIGINISLKKNIPSSDIPSSEKSNNNSTYQNIYENIGELIQNMTNNQKSNIKYTYLTDLKTTNLKPFDLIYHFIYYEHTTPYSSRKIIDYIYEKISILSNEEKKILSVIILKRITQKYFMQFIKYSYNSNSRAVKEVMVYVKYLILILYKLGKKYFRTIRHIDILINSFISKIENYETIEIADSYTNSYYNAIKKIFDGLKINQGSTINEESSINEELNELIKNHIFLNHNKPSSKKTNYTSNTSNKLRQLFSSIDLDYNKVIKNGEEIKYGNENLTSIFRKILFKLHPNKGGSKNTFQTTSSIIDKIKEIYKIT